MDSFASSSRLQAAALPSIVQAPAHSGPGFQGSLVMAADTWLTPVCTWHRQQRGCARVAPGHCQELEVACLPAVGPFVSPKLWGFSPFE